MNSSELCAFSFFKHISLTLTNQDVKMVSFVSAKNRMQNLSLFILLVFGIWLLAISVVMYRIFALFNKLTRGVEEDLSKKGFLEVKKRLDWLEENGKDHIQKVGIVRFNPFRELGGDHSFSLAILDAYNSGVVITSLHTRDRTRVYMKDIKKGKSASELSKEEEKALAIAEKGR